MRLQLSLPYRPPLDFAALIGFLALRAVPGVEEVESGAWRRGLAVPGFTGVVTVREAGDGEPALELSLASARRPSAATVEGIARAVTRVFDLDADPAAVAAHLGKDRRLAPLLAARPGLRVAGAFDPFEMAVRGIVGQQITVKGAVTLLGRIAQAHGVPLEGGRGLTHVFPGPAALAEVDLAPLGLTRARAAAVQSIARALRDGALTLERGATLDETVARLVALPGIGPWTAQYVAMRALGERDAFVAGDLGVRKALARGKELPSVAEVERRAERWRPYRAYAVMQLWAGP
ncbi:MAG TPA: DNA-3-methyladenine glycosylase [Anaeromyxobacteraceae bacterium]|jgi:AraC family transcriptional regulator of adaptative response / DNA-3-methyladenine glycosylase II|nr:DNA-3-methyladenine glycosylase [Anaeromyxobacteraceae bacterium]